MNREPASRRPVLILGGGINGAAVARELVLNHVPVWLVDLGDVGGGATAASSRLIHGGVRYLEYGDFELVREALAERGRLLRLAPQFVHPLELFIPVERRLTGVVASLSKLLTGRAGRWMKPTSRGLWLIRLGLHWYDRFQSTDTLPKHTVHSVGEPGVPPVDPHRFRWLCAYWDGQITYPERYVLALLEDARQLASAHGIEFRVFTYRRARWHPDRWHEAHVEIIPVDVERSPLEQAEEQVVVQPRAIVNATGAWIDHTLKKLAVPSPRLIGGTKGSHFFTAHDGLRQALAGHAVYAEADDGRPVFILPFGPLSLVGTTDLPFDDLPERAVASDEELDYLLALVRRVFPQFPLGRNDVLLHYSGVRPLPVSRADTPAAVTRRHHIAENHSGPVPIYSLIGGKLTTSRALAEEAVAVLCRRFDLPVVATSRDRPVPGGEGYPATPEDLSAEQTRIADSCGYTVDQVRATWRLLGTRSEAVLKSVGSGNGARQSVAATNLPAAVVRYAIDHEWATRLDDLVERRLMLLYDPNLSRACLRELAQHLVDAKRLAGGSVDSAVDRYCERLRHHFGRELS